MTTRKDSPGFTLIEVIVSLTIMAAIMTMVYGSYAAITRSMDASGTHMACEERMCFALRLMARHIRCAYAPCPDTGPAHPTTMTAGLNGPAAPSALFRGDSRDPQGEILSFITSGGTGAGLNAPRGLCRVTYRYDTAAQTLGIRRDDQNSPQSNRTPFEDSDTVLRNVTSVELKFHDGRQWQSTWDYRQRRALPKAVSVGITVADEMDRPHHLATIVPIVERVGVESEGARRTTAAGQL